MLEYDYQPEFNSLIKAFMRVRCDCYASAVHQLHTVLLRSTLDTLHLVVPVLLSHSSRPTNPARVPKNSQYRWTNLTGAESQISSRDISQKGYRRTKCYPKRRPRIEINREIMTQKKNGKSSPTSNISIPSKPSHSAPSSFDSSSPAATDA